MAYLNRKNTQQIPVTTITGATTLTVSQSGMTVVCSTTSGTTGYAVTLPSMASGTWFFRFFSNIAWTGTALTIEAHADDQDKVVGQVYAGAGSDEDSEVTLGADKVTFAASAAVISDSCDIFTDGTSIFVRGFCNATGGITLDG
jgi:hypothetical protein